MPPPQPQAANVKLNEFLCAKLSRVMRRQTDGPDRRQCSFPPFPLRSNSLVEKKRHGEGQRRNMRARERGGHNEDIGRGDLDFIRWAIGCLQNNNEVSFSTPIGLSASLQVNKEGESGLVLARSRRRKFQSLLREADQVDRLPLHSGPLAMPAAGRGSFQI